MVVRARRPRKPGLAAVAFVGLLAAVAPPSSADHAQTESGRVVVFDHRTGNEWWVEVSLSGQDAGAVAGVDAQDTNGAWTPLQKKSWGAWAASFHIEPGHQVRFRATWSGGAQAVSCWFDHPSGAERCATPTSTTTTTTSASSTSTSASATSTSGSSPILFDHKGGNDWWVEARVTGATPTRAQAQDTGGPWTELQLKSWGNWAASFRVEPGNLVRFRAEVAGTWSESCWFTHPAGRTPSGGETCGPTSTSTTASSSTTTASISTSTAPAPFAAFSGVKGNPYWVEARVASSKPLSGVQANVDDGPWQALTLRSWGAWAASFPIPDGSYVQLRAVAQDGSTALSQDYVWPTVRPVGAWPVSGSFVTYRLHVSGGAPDGTWTQSTDATLRLTYAAGAWSGRCTGSTTTTDHTNQPSTASFDQAVAQGAPASGPRNVLPGQEFDPVLFEDTAYGSCHLFEDTLVAAEQGRFQTSLRDSPGGRQVVLASWMAHEPAENTPYEADTFVWETRLGLMLDWSHSGRGGGFNGHLVDTDAPIR